MQIFTPLFFIFAGLTTLADWYLESRQRRSVAARRDVVPVRFAGVMTPDAHRKAADYTLAGLYVRRYFRLWELALLLLWTLGGGLEWLDRMVRHAGWNEPVTGTAVLAGFFFISHMLELPFDLWRRFGIEARFGFNPHIARARLI